MKCRFGDENLYDFHDNDHQDTCFLCCSEEPPMLIVRDAQSRRMIHICGDCLVNRCSEYYLDNTRPWEVHR